MVLDDMQVSDANNQKKENEPLDKLQKKKKKLKKDKSLSEKKKLKITNFHIQDGDDAEIKCKNDSGKVKKKLKRSHPNKASMDYNEPDTSLKNKTDTGTVTPKTSKSIKLKKGDKTNESESLEKWLKKKSKKDKLLAEHDNPEVTAGTVDMQIQYQNDIDKIKKKIKRKSYQENAVLDCDISKAVLKHKKFETDADTHQVLKSKKSKKVDKNDELKLETLSNIKMTNNQEYCKANEICESVIADENSTPPKLKIYPKLDKFSDVSEISKSKISKKGGKNCKPNSEVLADAMLTEYNQEDVNTNEHVEDNTKNSKTKRNDINDSENQPHIYDLSSKCKEEENEESNNKNERNKKYKRKRNRSKKQKLPEKNMVFAFDETHPAIAYLCKWKNDKQNWSFKKARQIWLLHHMYDEIAVPDNYFSILLEYLSSSQGNAKSRTLEDAEKFFNQNCEKKDENIKLKLERCRKIIQTLSS